MGSFLFKWEHPAQEVYVTGTFDDWARSVKLEKKEHSFERSVELPKVEKVYYKFVVDGNWTTDHTAPQETDSANNVNNVLHPDSMSSKPASAGGAFIGGVTPQSTTAQLAGNAPKESEKTVRPDTAGSDIHSKSPNTPFHDAHEFNVDPLPATAGIGNPTSLAPGEPVPHPSSLTDNTVQSTVRDDASLAKADEKAFGVAPLPATAGIGNPISLKPGEKVPDPASHTSNTVTSNVTLDRESYENGPKSTEQNSQQTGTEGAMFNLPPVSRNMIPESSLPMRGVDSSEKDPGFIVQSAGADTTTAALAGQVPKEPRGVPVVVSNSQHAAGVSPEASGDRDAVKEKSAMEDQLEKTVPEEPAASENSTGAGYGVGKAAGIGAAAGAGAAATGLTASQSKESRGLPASVQKSIDEMNSGTAIAPTVPDVVQESIAEAHQSPEAAASKNMVGEKTAVEKELLQKTPAENMAGEPAPSTSAALSSTAPGASTTDGKSVQDLAPMTSAAAPAQPPAAVSAMKQAAKQPPPESRDISPMTKPTTNKQTQPTVTTGVASSSAPQKSTPSSTLPNPTVTSPATTDRKAKRASGFFGKLKNKFSDKDKTRD